MKISPKQESLFRPKVFSLLLVTVGSGVLPAHSERVFNPGENDCEANDFSLHRPPSPDIIKAGLSPRAAHEPLLQTVHFIHNSAVVPELFKQIVGKIMEFTECYLHIKLF